MLRSLFLTFCTGALVFSKLRRLHDGNPLSRVEIRGGTVRVIPQWMNYVEITMDEDGVTIPKTEPDLVIVIFKESQLVYPVSPVDNQMRHQLEPCQGGKFYIFLFQPVSPIRGQLFGLLNAGPREDQIVSFIDALADETVAVASLEVSSESHPLGTICGNLRENIVRSPRTRKRRLCLSLLLIVIISFIMAIMFYFASCPNRGYTAYAILPVLDRDHTCYFQLQMSFACQKEELKAMLPDYKKLAESMLGGRPNVTLGSMSFELVPPGASISPTDCRFEQSN